LRCRLALLGSGLYTGKPLLDLMELLIERFGATAQMQDLREQHAKRRADDKAADALVDRDSDHAEQDRQSPGCPLRRGSFFCLHVRTRGSARY
jgi:hypothetical protein